MTASLASKTNWPAKNSTSLREVAVLVDRGVDVEAVLQADLVVLLAVARGGVDAAGAGVEGDEGRQDEDGLAVDEGMAAP